MPAHLAGAAPDAAPKMVRVSITGAATAQPGDILRLNLSGLQHSIAASDVEVSLAPRGAAKPPIRIQASSAKDQGDGDYLIVVTVPASLSPEKPTEYELKIKGSDSSGAAFAAEQGIVVTVNPPASIASMTRNSAHAGQIVAVTIEGSYTGFVQGVTQASFGAGISVGGAAQGAPGPVKVISATEAIATLRIDHAGAAGRHDVTITSGGQTVIAKDGFTVEPELRVPALASGGPYSGTAGSPVTFDASQSTDLNGSPLELTWDAGDHGSASGEKAQHIYATPGTYTVTLTGTDAQGATATVHTTATIAAAAAPTAINIAGLASGTVGQNMAFNAAGSTEPVTGVRYTWDFGDGTSSTGPIANHAYAQAGSYTVTLTAVDSRGPATSATTRITIAAVGREMPVADAGGPYKAAAGAPVQFDGSRSSGVSSSTAVFEWSFGDGESATGLRPTHAYAAPGSYTVTLTVTNERGESNTTSALVKIAEAKPADESAGGEATDTTPAPPVAAPGGPYAGIPKEEIQFNGLQSSGPAGKTLTYAWSFGDKGTATGVQPEHAYAAAGTYTVTLTVSDGVASAKATTTAKITAVIAMTITTPTAGTLTNKPSIAVSGTVADATAKVVVNGTAASVSTGKWTAKTVALREGVNLITATATDKSGATGTANVSVTLDTTPPSVSIVSPAPNAKVFSPQITVSGLVSDLVAGTVNAQNVTVLVNGVAASVVNRSFSAPNVLLSPGSNTINVVATDKAGNTGQASVQIKYQNTVTQQAILPVSGDGQSGVINSTLAQPLVAQLIAASGQPVAGRPITFTVTRSDGQVEVLPSEGSTLTVLSDIKGHASVLFKLGSRAGVGVNQVTATSPGFTGQAIFGATTVNDVPAFIHPVIGEHQRGVIGQPAPQPFQVIVTDRMGNPLANVPVTFDVTAGGGNIGGESKVTQETNSDGKATVTVTLGLQEGVDNNIVSANFSESKVAPVAFHASGIVPGPAAQTSVTGLVLDNTNTPVQGATVSLDGTNLRTTTDKNGHFTLSGAPVGTVTLLVDGATSSSTISYPSLSFVLQALPGVANSLDKPIYLPKIDTENAQTVGGNEPVTLTMTGVPGVEFTVQPNSVTFPDGSHVGKLSVSQVKADMVPMEPVNGVSAPLVWTIQPAGAKFNPPIQVQLPNVNGLAPGTVTEVYQYDHDLEQFVSGGTARVSPDGSVIVSDPGFGIVKAGWGHQLPPPPQINCTASCDDDNDCTQDSFTYPCGCSHTPTSGNSCGQQNQNQPGKNSCFLSQGICKMGVCSGQKKPPGTSCDSGSFCSNPGACDANGACMGKPIPDSVPTYGSTFSVDLTAAFESVQKYVAALTGGLDGSLTYTRTSVTKYSCCDNPPKQIKQAKDEQQNAKLTLGITIAKVYVPQYTFLIPGTKYKIGPYASFGINGNFDGTYHISECRGNCIDGGFGIGGSVSVGYGGSLPGELLDVDLSATAGITMSSTIGCKQVSYSIGANDLTGQVSFKFLDGILGLATNVLIYPGSTIATGSVNVP